MQVMLEPDLDPPHEFDKGVNHGELAGLSRLKDGGPDFAHEFGIAGVAIIPQEDGNWLQVTDYLHDHALLAFSEQ